MMGDEQKQNDEEQYEFHIQDILEIIKSRITYFFNRYIFIMSRVSRLLDYYVRIFLLILPHPFRIKDY